MGPLRTKVCAALAAAAICLGAFPAQAVEPLRILATGVFASSLRALAEPFAASGGAQLDIAIANAGQVAARTIAGEPADLVMSSAAGIKTLTQQGLLAPQATAIGTMRLGVAVPAGASLPNLASPEAFRALLLSAGKVAYIDPQGGGTSGPFFEKMFVTLNVADAVHAKAILGKDGAEIVRAVASRGAPIGMTQASEIIGAEGVAFAGYIPDTLNLITPYAAGITAKSQNPKAAAAFLAFLATPTAAARLRQAGWTLPQ